MEGTDLSLRKRLKVVADVAQFRPAATAILVGLNLVVAILSGIGVGFIVPIIGLVVGDTGGGTDGGVVQEAFVQAYQFLGLPLTLETAVGGVACVLLVRYVLQLTADILKAKLEASYVRHLRSAMFDRLLGAQVDTVDDIGEDNALNTIITEARRAGNIPYTLVGLVQSVLLIFAFGAVAFTIAPTLTVLTVVLLGGITAFVRYVVESGLEAGDRLVAANEAVQRASRRGITGLREVKLFAVRDRFQDAFEQSIAEHADASVRIRMNRSVISVLQQAIVALSVFALLYVGIAFYAVGPAELAAFLFAMFRAAPQVTSANNYFYTLESDLPHAVSIQEFRQDLAAVAEPSDGTAAVPHPIREVASENVRFSYDDTDQVLDGVSFRVTRGETVAIVGQSGAGKSTLATLIARFHRPTAGELTVNDVPLDAIELTAWREAIGVVRQHPYIFDGTLRENLTIGVPSATDDAIHRACAAARVDEFLDDLPNGLDTDLGEDAVKLSGGQRQRVAIARMLLTEPDFLVLDEATSDLDSTLQMSIMGRLREQVGDIPILLIAHRESTVKSADRVVVLDGGIVVERGAPEMLRNQDGTYAALYERQFDHSMELD